MKSFRNIKDDKLGDEAPRFQDFMIVVAVVVILLLLSWITYYKLGWFH